MIHFSSTHVRIARLMSLATAVGASALLLAPLAAHAANNGPYYAATPVATPSQTTLITNGTVWKWQETAYVANKGPQRPAIMCEMVAQRAGKLSAFMVGGTALDTPALDKCNARVK